MDTNIKYLLSYCYELPDLYNDVATKLWVQFGIRNAELSLLCTYMINEWRIKDEHRKRNPDPDQKMGKDKKSKEDHAGGDGKTIRVIPSEYSEF